MDEKITFLIVEDDETTELTLKKIITKVFPSALVFSAKDGLYAIEFMTKLNKPFVIICDFNIPGINGMQILGKVREHPILKESFFVLITSHLDKELNIKSIQQGADDFMTKPFSVDQIIAKMRIGANFIQRYFELQKLKKHNETLEEELVKNAEKTIEIFLKLQSIKFPEIGKMIPRMQEAAEWIIGNLGEFPEEEINNMKTAIALCYVGKVFLPDNLVNQPVMVNGFVKSPEMNNVPTNVNDLIGKIRGYENVANILTHVYENLDGSGIPDRLIGAQIPTPSRLIRTLLDYEELMPKLNGNTAKALEILEQEANRVYEFRLLALIDQFLAHQSMNSKNPRERVITRAELEEGMVISRNIITNSGMKIISSGVRVNAEKVEKIREMTKEDPIIGKIYVLK